MSLRPTTARALRAIPRHLSRSQCLPLSQTRHLSSSPSKVEKRDTEAPARGAIDPITLHRLEVERRAYYKRRSYYAGAGFILGMIAIWVTATSIDLPPKPEKLDSASRPNDPLVVLGRERKVIVQKLGEEPEEIPDVVETGTSTVPTFPRVFEFFDDESGVVGERDDRFVEYQLMGLGIRTVSFLGIQVYVVGMYVATDDIAALQGAMIRKIAPTATSLVAGEKEQLKKLLADPVKGEEAWSEVLRDSGVRTIVRIVPTRDTDFHHLRDAWVRSVTGRAQRSKEEYGDEAFGTAVAEFKKLFNRGSVPKKKELLLSRDHKGKVSIWYDNGKTGAERLGAVEDERLSRAIWLNYLAGKTVSSESARQSILNGVMEFVERPVGTVATQVHV